MGGGSGGRLSRIWGLLAASPPGGLTRLAGRPRARVRSGFRPDRR